jgi:protocatechuate 3,4-dioxygenase beta subunit
MSRGWSRGCVARHVLVHSAVAPGRHLAAVLAIGLGIGVAPVANAHVTSTGAPIRRSDVARARPCYQTLVVGTVLDADGHAVPNASVIARPVSGEKPIGTIVTDRQGHFRLVGIPPGEYWFLGFHGDHPFGMTPALPVGERLEVEIVLDLAVTSA